MRSWASCCSRLFPGDCSLPCFSNLWVNYIYRLQTMVHPCLAWTKLHLHAQSRDGRQDDTSRGYQGRTTGHKYREYALLAMSAHETGDAVVANDDNVLRSWLQPLLRRLAEETEAFGPGLEANHVLLNAYRSGEGIMPHQVNHLAAVHRSTTQILSAKRAMQ